MNTRAFVIVLAALLLIVIVISKLGNVDLIDVPESNDNLTACAFALHAGIVRAGIELDSQCVGRCGNYSVDIVHVPRSESDDLAENQCRDYRERITTGFIEMDAEGNVVRVVG